MYSLTNFLQDENILSLNNIVTTTGAPLEGNCLYEHRKDFALNQTNKEDLGQNKFNLCLDRKNIIKVGFNAGHSSALYLYANRNIEIVSFDLCRRRYTEICAKYLTEKYSFELIKGDSLDTVPAYNPGAKFSLIHIDGGHTSRIALLDIINCKKFADKQTLLIIDDAYIACIKRTIEFHSSSKVIAEINDESFRLAKTKFHRIFRYP